MLQSFERVELSLGTHLRGGGEREGGGVGRGRGEGQRRSGTSYHASQTPPTWFSGQEVTIDLVPMLPSNCILVSLLKCDHQISSALPYLWRRGEIPLNSEVINEVARRVSPEVEVEAANHLVSADM